MFKEILTNVAKHSSCNRASVNLKVSGNEVSLSVIDDGLGFDRETVRRGNGLDNISSRSGLLGGTVAVESAPGKGTRWDVRFAIEKST
jgi:signal transduction histidine kinase